MKKPWKPGAGPGGSARPGTGHRSIRGRISGPYPITAPADDEFPMRNPGTGIATPLGAEFKESTAEPGMTLGEQEPRTPPAPPAPPASSVPLDTAHPTTNTAQSNGQNTDTAPSNPALPPARRISPGHRVNPSGTMRYSMMSVDTNHSKASKGRPQRKKSTLRGAFGKIFNRRRKTSSEGGPSHIKLGDSPKSLTSNHQRSATVDMLQEPLENKVSLAEQQRPPLRSRPYPGAESKRSASLPITEFDRALRSHSIGPEDVLAIESARNSISGDFGLAQRRAAELRARESDLAGLSPRPASAQGRDGRATHGNEDPEEIGRAITSDFTGRRRSRSMSGLIEVEEEGNTSRTSRRRSDEIRYWRESYDPAFMSPVSSNIPENDETRPDSPATTEKTEEKPVEKHPEPFTFGTFANMGEMAGMKITQAASLETRLGQLESRVRQLEQVLTHLCKAIPDFQLPTESLDRPESSIFDQGSLKAYGTGATTDYRSADPGETNKRTSSVYPDSSSQSEISHPVVDEPATALHPTQTPASQNVSIALYRPTSTATIKGAAKSTSVNLDHTEPFNMDHYTTLMALIQTERSAREALEAEVKKLGYQVSILANFGVGMDDHDYDPPPTAKSFGDYSAFDHDDGSEDIDRVERSKPRGHSVQHEDSGIATTQGDESEYETFETPVEEIHTFGAFGEHLSEEDEAQKKAARTLSLSQLTLGKKALASSAPHPPQFP